MTISVVPFQAAHSAGVLAHPKQHKYQPLLKSQDFHGRTWSALDGDDLVAVGGLVPLEGELGGWLLFTDKITPQRFIGVFRAVQQVFAAARKEGVGVAVDIDPDYPEAVRMAGMLGLSRAGFFTAPDGRTMTRMCADV